MGLCRNLFRDVHPMGRRSGAAISSVDLSEHRKVILVSVPLDSKIFLKRHIIQHNSCIYLDFDFPLPSVEGNTEPAVADFSIVIPCAMSPPPAKSFDAKNDRPFACIGCGKTYKFVGNLERVSYFPLLRVVSMLICRVYHSTKLCRFVVEMEKERWIERGMLRKMIRNDRE
jgi:hypothetical protein